MKKITMLCSILGSFILHAQTPCENGRFAEDVFENVTVTSNIVYGQNSSWTGANTTLQLDFYEPQGDDMEARPLLIWVHGGSFQFGSRTDQDVVTLSDRFAKKGYACASISYRVGFFPIDSTNAVRAVVRATQDLRSAIRYFYKDAATDNNYRIDTTNIYIGGSSAGAITALHVAYLNEECELLDYLNESQQAQLGGIEGTSGNPGYSSKVRGVMNGAGALARYSWMDISELNIPLASVHGTNDDVVTYNRGIVNPGVPLMYLDGSRMLHERACAIGLENQLFTFNGAGHVPYFGTSASAQAYMDTTVNFYRDFLVSQLDCNVADLQPANTWAQDAVLYAAEYCDGSPVNEVCALSSLDSYAKLDFDVYPNPASNVLTIDFPHAEQFTMLIRDLSGRTVFQKTIQSSQMQVDISGLSSGTYIVQIGSLAGDMLLSKKLSVQ